MEPPGPAGRTAGVHRLGGTALAGFLLVALVGCGSSADPAPGAPGPATSPTAASSSVAAPGAASSAAAAPAVITIKDFAFTAPAGAPAGATIQVKNDDSEAHTVTADVGGFDVMLAPGATARFTAPTEPGSYPFHCTYHSNMRGTLVVS
jgi:plastocyanin